MVNFIILYAFVLLSAIVSPFTGTDIANIAIVFTVLNVILNADMKVATFPSALWGWFGGLAYGAWLHVTGRMSHPLIGQLGPFCMSFMVFWISVRFMIWQDIRPLPPRQDHMQYRRC